MRYFSPNSSNYSFVRTVEPLQNKLSIKYFYSRYNIYPEKNEDIYGVDYLFIHPKTGQEIGVEYKTCMPWNWRYKNIQVYSSSQNNDSSPNQIYKELEKQPIHWHYLHPGSNQLFIIYDQDKLKTLYNNYSDKLIPTKSANLYMFDKIIEIPEDDPILIEIKNQLSLI